MTALPLALYRGQDVKKLDNLAISQDGLSGYALMCRAGVAAWQVLQTYWPQAKAITVFCGHDNNGGDGYVLARLAQEQGLLVRVYNVTPLREKSTPEAEQARQDWLKVGEIALFNGESLQGDVIVDALLGTGAKSPLAAPITQAILQMNQSRLPVLAIDLPSGLHSDTGANLGAIVKADVTLTFIGLKVGLFLHEAAEYVGKVLFASLDISEALYSQVKPCAWRLVHSQAMSALQPRARNAHKGDFGHVVVIGGGQVGYCGAPLLASEASMRAGAGLVSAIVAPESLPLLARAPRELMCYTPKKAKDCTELLARANVLVVGPGLSQNAWGKHFFQAAIASDKTKVVDADALNWLAQYPQKSDHWVLTPHPGEAARLLKQTVAEVQQDWLQAATLLQQRYGGVVVLKGAGTIIVSKDDVVVHPGGIPALATAGTGDVLAGLIGGLLAQKLSLMQAAMLGVSVHAQAALIEQSFGERGMIASDLLLHIRSLLNVFDES